MKFRLKAFGLHWLGSSLVLAMVLGGFYLGWYRWPGWYLTGVVHVALIIVGIDVALGPLMTLLIASEKKPRRELARDISVIVTVQLAALIYGSVTLWQGRPLYYTFSVDRLEIVQAFQLSSSEIAAGRRENPGLAPHWYSLPRWVWVPLPQDEAERTRVITQVVTGSGADFTQMPKYFRPWAQGAAELRKQLKTPDHFGIFSKKEQRTLKERMARLGFPTDQPITLFLTGTDRPVLAVFDLGTVQIKAILRAD